MPQLIVSVGGMEVRHVYLSKDRTTLGRGPENDIVLQNPAVSASHCEFQLKGLSDVFAEDMGSTNGTFVNNKRIKRQRLRDEDVLAIAGFRIRFLTAAPDSGFGATAAMAAGADSQFPTTPAHASFRVLTGSSAGLEVPVNKAVSTFGKPGVAVIVVAHRRTGYYAAHLDGAETPQINGRPLRQDPVLLAHHDVVELAGTAMQFVLAS